MKNTIEKALQRQKAEREKQQKEKQEESPRFGHDSAVETQESESTKKVSSHFQTKQKKLSHVNLYTNLLRLT